MGILLIFAFLSGIVTIFAPCIWPILPIILSSSTTGGKKKPLGITLGIVISFAVFTLTISYIVKIIPFDPTILRYIAVLVIGFLGLSLVVPRLSHIFEGFVSSLSSRFGIVKSSGSGFGSGFVTGISLGIIWTPCAGPILATIATLAATQTVNLQIVLVTIVYVIGIGIPLYIFTLLGQSFFIKSRFVSKYTGRIQQIFGVIMIITAVLIATNYDKTLQVRLLDAFPSYSRFIINLENVDPVKKELDKLRDPDMEDKIDMSFPKASDTSKLPVIAKAPDFVGISNWLNSDSLTIDSLRGKVVLVDFWTYTCINCIRTLPHIVNWYDKYKNKGFVVVGVHTPEFEFEKKTENVQMAISQYGIKYPVAQDNDYATWQAYDNHYWPAKYLIDAKGNIRYFHFGEGEYDVTEKNIQLLLKEVGVLVKEKQLTDMKDETPGAPLTPETYLGFLRAERFHSTEEMGPGINYYSYSKVLNTNEFAFSGSWNVKDEYSESVNNARLHMRFEANKVFLVMHPTSENQRVAVYLNNKLVDAEAGKDVVDGYVYVTEPRLYELIDLKGNRGTHIIELKFDDGVQIFAFTFG